MTLSVGARLGPYEITAPLGAGGMGEVFRGHDRKLNREVAIKVLPAAFAQDPGRVARFRREALVLATLNHPNIASIFGLEESDGVLALIMELAEGEDLAVRLRRGPIPLREVVGIARQIAMGIGEAHDRGVIHRDLKPANLKVASNGTVKILDFGLAKACDTESSSSRQGEADPSATTQAPPLTEAGVVHGTPAYMSPEQARGQALDQRSDIWAFGCVLYEMLSGQRAFAGRTSSDVIAKILEREPDWDAIPKGTPASLERDLRRCLQKDTRLRLRHIGDAMLDDDPTPPGTTSVAASRATHRGLTVALALAGWALLAALLLQPVATPPPWSLEPLEFEIDAGDPESLAVSADGTTLAWVAPGADGTPRIRWRPLRAAAARELPGTENATFPFLSPDGKAVGFFTNGGLKRVDTTSGAVRVLRTDLSGVSLGGTWNAASQIVFSNRFQLMVVPATGGEPKEVAALDRSRQENSLRFPQFLPDGRHFVYVARSGQPEKSSAYVGSLDGPPRRLLATLSKVVFASPHHLLFLQGNNLVSRRLETDTMELDPVTYTVTTDVAARNLSVGGAFAASDTGVLVYSPATAPPAVSLRWYDRAGRDLGALAEPGGYAQFRIAPDGLRVAAALNDEKAGSRSVWILRNGRTPSRLTFPGTHDWEPVWSPDGARLAFASYRDGVLNIYSKSADGSGGDEPLILSEFQKDLGDFSPDGRFLVYRDTQRTIGGDIVVRELSGTRRRIELMASDATEFAPRFSGDGRFVAYVSDETGVQEVFVQPFPPTGVKWQASVGGGESPAWPGNGSELYFVNAKGMLMALPIDTRASSFTPGHPRPLFMTKRRGRFQTSFDVTGDGRRFLIAVAAPEERAPRTRVVLNWAKALKK